MQGVDIGAIHEVRGIQRYRLADAGIVVLVRVLKNHDHRVVLDVGREDGAAWAVGVLCKVGRRREAHVAASPVVVGIVRVRLVVGVQQRVVAAVAEEGVRVDVLHTVLSGAGPGAGVLGAVIHSAVVGIEVPRIRNCRPTVDIDNSGGIGRGIE